MPDPKPAEAPQTCPECGADLTNRNPWAHALDHWPEKIPVEPKTELARERQAALFKMAKARGLI